MARIRTLSDSLSAVEMETYFTFFVFSFWTIQPARVVKVTFFIRLRQQNQIPVQRHFARRDVQQGLREHSQSTLEINRPAAQNVPIRNGAHLAFVARRIGGIQTNRFHQQLGHRQ